MKQVLFILPALFLCSCSLTEERDITVTSSPEGALAFINEEYAGVTPLGKTVPNREKLTIYLEKNGYSPVKEEYKPEESFWGWLLWGGMSDTDKNISLPSDSYHFDMNPLSPGEKAPPRPLMAPRVKKTEQTNSLRRIAMPE